LITVDNIEFSYSPDSPVFKQFSLQIKKGALFGLLAPNGAGKTSLIKLITGINVPDSGKVLIDGKDFQHDRNSILNNIAVVPQEYAFYSQFTAYENLQFFSKLYRHTDSKQKIETALKLTRLEEHKHRVAKNFSGGLKRRLNFAIGLLNEPDLLILDEPTVGIDAQSRKFILQAITDLNKNGTTVLFTSHYIDEIEEICDTVTIMDSGKILTIGRLDELLQSQSNVTIRLNNKNNSDTDSFNHNEQLRDLLQREKFTLENNQICGRLSSAEKLSAFINQLATLGYEMNNLQYGQHTLESLYFELIDANNTLDHSLNNSMDDQK